MSLTDNAFCCCGCCYLLQLDLSPNVVQFWHTVEQVKRLMFSHDNFGAHMKQKMVDHLGWPSIYITIASTLNYIACLVHAAQL
jgi:hypothetical protein